MNSYQLFTQNKNAFAKAERDITIFIAPKPTVGYSLISKSEIMFARCTLLSFSPEKRKEATHIYLTEVAPAIRKQKGSKQVTWLEPADGSDEFISMSVWDEEADIKAFEASADYPAIIGKIKVLASKPPVQKYYSING